MTTLVVKAAHASWYRPATGSKGQDLAVEAYEKAVEDLKKDVDVSGDTSKWAQDLNSIDDVYNAVRDAKQKYEEKSKEHSGTRSWLEKFSSRVMYYGKVLDVLSQHHPEYVSLAWGAVKVVLMGIINRATLVQKLAQAFVAIGDVLPRAELSAELYQTEHMKIALSRLYTYIIMFLRLCVRWYNRSPLGRLWSAIKSPFDLDYADILEQIKICSRTVEDFANAGARAEIRHIRTVLELLYNQSRERDVKLLDKSTKLDASMDQLLQVATSSKTITERMSEDVRGISQGVYRIEFHNLVQFFAPDTSQDAALRKAHSFARRDPALKLLAREHVRTRKVLDTWASENQSSLLLIRVGLREYRQAKDLAAEVVNGLTSSSECVFWNISSSLSANSARNMSDVFKSLIHQALKHSPDLFAQFAEQLNLIKVHTPHIDREWADLICLLFSKIPKAFIIIETRDMHKAHRHDVDWAPRFVELLQTIVDSANVAGNMLKMLVVVYGNTFKGVENNPSTKELCITSISPPAPVPPRMRHVARQARLSTLKSWRLQAPKMS